jgi:hypothetical protein
MTLSITNGTAASPLPLTVSEAARRLGAAPRLISDLLYARRVPDGVAPLVGKVRLIDPAHLTTIAAELRKAGHAVVG